MYGITTVSEYGITSLWKEASVTEVCTGTEKGAMVSGGCGRRVEWFGDRLVRSRNSWGEFGGCEEWCGHSVCVVWSRDRWGVGVEWSRQLRSGVGGCDRTMGVGGVSVRREGVVPSGGGGVSVRREGVAPSGGGGVSVRREGVAPSGGGGVSVSREGVAPSGGGGVSVRREGVAPSGGGGVSVSREGVAPSGGVQYLISQSGQLLPQILNIRPTVGVCKYWGSHKSQEDSV